MSGDYSVCTVIFCGGGGCCVNTRSVPLLSSSLTSSKPNNCKIHLCMHDVQAIKLLSNSVHISFFRVLAEREFLFLRERACSERA